MEWIVAAAVFGSIYLVAMGPALASLLARPARPPEDLDEFLREHLEFARQCREGASPGAPPDSPSKDPA